MKLPRQVSTKVSPARHAGSRCRVTAGRRVVPFGVIKR